jgi:predicted Zn finger-like uncharacterized protein
MQVTCPNCGARYAVDPLAIGPVGRIVQCARCANRWLQTVAAAHAQTAARQAVDAAMNAPQTAPSAATAAIDTPSGGAASSSGPSPGPSKGPARSFEQIEPVPDLVIRPPRQRTSLPAVIAPRRRRRLPVVLLATIGTVIVIAVLAAAIYTFRDPILAKLPAEWRTLLHL